ncbi:MAG TPA: carbohydrate porin [Puia sp.]|nr:carbohydrate porin [Puia sp.]
MKRIISIGILQICSLAVFSQYVFDSSGNWSAHFQTCIVDQWHGFYHFPYAGPSSLDSNKEHALSVTTTLFLGRKLWKDAAIYFNPELTGGSGLSLTHGAAGFPNGEIYRVGNPAPTPFVARLYVQQNFAIGDSRREAVDDDVNQVKDMIPSSRITVNLGKFCLADFFDDNAYNHDARSQFLNWSLMQQGAWDFPADTRGYTSGVEVELVKPGWAVRYAFVQVPVLANGLEMDWNLWRYNGQTAEFEKRFLLSGKPGAIRFTAFMNITRAPRYSEVVASLKSGDSSYIAILDGSEKGPDNPSIKYGFSLNGEQDLGGDIGFFFRFGWNDGQTASWAFTDIDRNLQLGINARGKLWHRQLDNFGLALAVNGISKVHQDYFRAGGWSFIIGDGALNYGHEQILEAFYRASLMKFISLGLDYQMILNPGYNKDRKGPISVPSFRVQVAL